VIFPKGAPLVSIGAGCTGGAGAAAGACGCTLGCCPAPFCCLLKEEECIGVIGVAGVGVGGCSVSEAGVAPVVTAFFFADFYNEYQQ